MESVVKANYIDGMAAWSAESHSDRLTIGLVENHWFFA